MRQEGRQRRHRLAGLGIGRGRQFLDRQRHGFAAETLPA
jgi:hypothetical protein